MLSLIILLLISSLKPVKFDVSLSIVHTQIPLINLKPILL